MNPVVATLLAVVLIITAVVTACISIEMYIRVSDWKRKVRQQEMRERREEAVHQYELAVRQQARQQARKEC